MTSSLEAVGRRQQQPGVEGDDDGDSAGQLQRCADADDGKTVCCDGGQPLDTIVPMTAVTTSHNRPDSACLQADFDRSKLREREMRHAKQDEGLNQQMAQLDTVDNGQVADQLACCDGNIRITIIQVPKKLGTLGSRPLELWAWLTP